LNFVLEIIIGLLIFPHEFLGPVIWSILFIFSGVVHVPGVGLIDLSLLLVELFSLSFKSTNSFFHIIEILLFLLSSNVIKVLLMLPVLLVEVINESVKVIDVLMFPVDSLVQVSELLIEFLIFLGGSGSVELLVDSVDLLMH
jgi:hypothetical protein